MAHHRSRSRGIPLLSTVFMRSPQGAYGSLYSAEGKIGILRDRSEHEAGAFGSHRGAGVDRKLRFSQERERAESNDDCSVALAEFFAWF